MEQNNKVLTSEITSRIVTADDLLNIYNISLDDWEIEKQVLNDLCWIPMMYESSFVLQYPEIKNFRKLSIIRNYVKYLKVEE